MPAEGTAIPVLLYKSKQEKDEGGGNKSATVLLCALPSLLISAAISLNCDSGG